MESAPFSDVDGFTFVYFSQKTKTFYSLDVLLLNENLCFSWLRLRDTKNFCRNHPLKTYGTIGDIINVPPKNRILIFLCRGYGLVGGVRDCVLVLLMQGVRLLWTGYDFFVLTASFLKYFS